MNEFQITKGPWEIHDDGSSVCIMPTPDSRCPDSFLGIGDVYRFEGERSEARVQANARAIAQVPAMLELVAYIAGMAGRGGKHEFGPLPNFVEDALKIVRELEED